MDAPDIDGKYDDVYAHKARAEWHWHRREYAQALAHVSACVLQKPSAGASLLYGTMCLFLGRLDDAETYLSDVIRRAPDCGQAHLNRAHLHLVQGQLERGFRELYEIREQFLDLYPVRIESKVPLWTGQDLRGRCIQLSSWEGAGDALQYIRYANVLKRRYEGVRVEALCPPALQALLASCPGVDRVWTVGDPVEPGDYFANLLNLPHLCGTVRSDDLPGETPYLFAPPARLAYWRQRLGTAPGKRRLAVCWRGNPKHVHDAMRSVPSEHFRALSRPDVELYSVQKDAADVPEGIQPLVMDDDFADTAAILTCMDLTVTVDTSIVHLAGALGLPVWLALARVPDYRWILERSDSPWYPTARLFRQRGAGQWASVFADMAAALDNDLPRVAKG